ncbi:hypothetical protein [Micromonospora maris]|uniref:hypothetical protein n=1 Tax=Micromonospora maris TaxID=1003110 RepID=UPI002E13EF4D|nr:hypothetical protein OG712_14560 [Micromonospora maris]
MFGGAMLGAAAFSADPADGFPPGAPAEPSAPAPPRTPTDADDQRMAPAARVTPA